MALTIKKNVGDLPEGLDRKVIFFANILALFYGNQTETDVLRKEVGALESYGSRLIPILNLVFRKRGNLLVLEREPEKELLKYFRETLHLDLPEIVVEPKGFYPSILEDNFLDIPAARQFVEQLGSHAAGWIDGYVTDKAMVRLAEVLKKRTNSTSEGSRRGNNKLLLHQYLASRNLPVFDTCIAKIKDDVFSCTRQLHDKGYTKAVIKAQIGASGIGMHKLNLNGIVSSDNIPDYLFYEGPCLVQGWLDESIENVEYVGSPSVQMFLTDKNVDLYDITEQLLNEDSVHQGNVAPPLYLKEEETLTIDLLTQAEIAARWLHEQGYRGTASADFHFIRRAGIPEIRICEINARVTGASYPSILARYFVPKDAWLLRNIRFSPVTSTDSILSALKDAGLLFVPQKKEGVLPINFNPDQQGNIAKGQFLFLGKTPEQAVCLLKKMTELTSLKGDYDRD